MKHPRNITEKAKKAMLDTPIILINGARQTGKSTLVKALIKNKENYITLDDPNIFAILKSRPLEFLQNLPSGAVIDEIQRVPEIFPIIKKILDENRSPSRFILTGSANILLLPNLSESLAGRMEIIEPI